MKRIVLPRVFKKKKLLVRNLVAGSCEKPIKTFIACEKISIYWYIFHITIPHSLAFGTNGQNGAVVELEKKNFI